MSKLSAAVLGLAAGACVASAPARAENLLGFYVGAGVGESTVRSDDNFSGGFGYDGFYNDPRHHFAWKAVAGIRPASKGNRAIVDSNVEVYNHLGEHVMTYTARRMLAGRDA